MARADRVRLWLASDLDRVPRGQPNPFRLGTGLQYSFSDRITVGAAYQYMNGGDADIDVERGPLAGRLEGDYKSYDVHFFALNLIWRL